MSDHIVTSYDEDLKALGTMIAEMGRIATGMLNDAIDALINDQDERARDVIARDPGLDALQREVEMKAILTIARRQPMAVDLREIIAAIRISGDLERVGDLSKNIAKRATKLSTENSRLPAAAGLKPMAEMAINQLETVLNAYHDRDIDAARRVWSNDASLDQLDNSVFRDLLTHMMEDPRNISAATHLIFCSKNIERAGDHATNIAETVYYLVTGDTLPLDRPKGS